MTRQTRYRRALLFGSGLESLKKMRGTVMAGSNGQRKAITVVLGQFAEVALESGEHCVEVMSGEAVPVTITMDRELHPLLWRWEEERRGSNGVAMMIGMLINLGIKLVEEREVDRQKVGGAAAHKKKQALAYDEMDNFTQQLHEGLDLPAREVVGKEKEKPGTQQGVAGLSREAADKAKKKLERSAFGEDEDES